MKYKKKLLKNKTNFKSKKKRKYRKIKFSINLKLPMIIFFIILYISLYILEKNNISLKLDENEVSLEQYHASILPELISFENNATLNLNQELYYEFRKINCDNKLLEENQKFEKSLNPDISVILLMYNQAHCIYKGIRSVQNQSFKNIEIIIVDGCSEDNSTEVVKEFQKEDPRIILITHDTNKGIITARSDGVRAAKGKYITIMDGDDTFIHKDILKNSLYIAQKGKLDVVEFKGNGYKFGRPVNVAYSYRDRNVSYIIHQPELRIKFIDKKDNGKKYEIYNRIIFGKLIENKLFKKVITYIGPEFTDDFIYTAEDTILALSLFHLAKSYYVMNEMGIFVSYDEKNNGFPKMSNKICKPNNKIKNLFAYKYFKFLVDRNSEDDIEKLMAFTDFKNFNHIDRILKTELDSRHYKILFHVHDKMLKWNCLNKEQKDYIMEINNKVIRRKNNNQLR